MKTTFEVRIKATSPCAKFYDASMRDQVQKIKEEVLELEEQLEAFLNAKDSEAEADAALELLIEMYDVIACVNTMHVQLATRHPKYFNEAMLKSAEIFVINKNMARGYYAAEV